MAILELRWPHAYATATYISNAAIAVWRPASFGPTVPCNIGAILSTARVALGQKCPLHVQHWGRNVHCTCSIGAVLYTACVALQGTGRRTQGLTKSPVICYNTKICVLPVCHEKHAVYMHHCHLGWPITFYQHNVLVRSVCRTHNTWCHFTKAKHRADQPHF